MENFMPQQTQDAQERDGGTKQQIEDVQEREGGRDRDSIFTLERVSKYRISESKNSWTRARADVRHSHCYI
jgi:hypothetical protein